METKEGAYLAYGADLAQRKVRLTSTEFSLLCARDICIARFHQPPDAMRFAVAAHLHPTFCVFPSDVLLGCGLVPFTNTSEAFEQFAAFGVTREEMKLMREENGSIAFALSLVGLVKCAVHYASIKELLEHTALMFDAFTAYEARIQTGVGA